MLQVASNTHDCKVPSPLCQSPAHRDKRPPDAGTARLQRWPFTVDAAGKPQDRPKPLFAAACAANAAPVGGYRFET